MSILIPVIEPPNTEGLILEEINRFYNGSYYIIFKLPQVSGGMLGERITIKVPKNKLDDFLRAHYLGKGVSK